MNPGYRIPHRFFGIEQLLLTLFGLHWKKKLSRSKGAFMTELSWQRQRLILFLGHSSMIVAISNIRTSTSTSGARAHRQKLGLQPPNTNPAASASTLASNGPVTF